MRSRQDRGARTLSPASVEADASRGGLQPARRDLLIGLAGGAIGFGIGSQATAMPAETLPAGDDGTQDCQPFYGLHQSGVITPQPAAALIASFDVLAEDRAGLERLFRTLTERIAFLIKGGEAPTLDPRYPPPDSGLLGPTVFPDNLTVTVALGASLFDDRYGLQKVRPTRLISMEQFPNDALDARLCHGDVALQFCSNTAETNIHALRDILRHTPDLLALRWKIDGFLPPHTIKKLGKETVRNLLGFKDGTANLDASDETLMNEIVWVQPNSDEPAWTSGGTYQVIRVIRMFVERWDRTALVEQQQIIGREKAGGAPLTYANERDAPDYAGDPKGERVPLTAHIRLANPRTPGTEANRILRRGYNYSRGVTDAGQLDMGLLFVCFQADLAAGFLTVQSRLNGERLEEYIKPVGGGYFFVLPGVQSKDDFFAEGLLRAAA
ncbi:MAG TPA: iron uptake transporter deferrochelatase/peroxidase subunit [Roseiarcus sp.]|nr:iron uptake transporter deferrochelatase/peroxidase subunit [Roseiarcus sp.]